MAYIVALTGGIGSGKSTVADMFARLGVPVTDADIIARQVVEPGTPALQAIAEHFGPRTLTADGTLDRAALRREIFADPEKKAWLNQLLHPLIHQETRRQLNNVTAPYALWVVPLLVENNLAPLADRVLVVDVYPHEQIARTMRRDGVSGEHAENILRAQASREQRLSVADDILTNHDNDEPLMPRVLALHEHYTALARQPKQEHP
ncbi:dephospho-CoA kinase [Morganella morganii]|uniref:dephospho-CoA kinase n=1 Tax=Morganella TaxID=581 RepID=UPI000D1D8BED|nr:MULTISPECIES: dephospho-CoA kinase [Morganella]HAE77367.1 dephospho-CoA kinase [Morganella sp. (in: enterobacteria)]QXO49145.1 dephospho-CoA kinase [Morganella morganii]QXO52985.1 dephospho-CoA kinase [Morganella morganii]QXO56839.1 dephospho-CoA kinase [Morganella morganii]QXO60672.1 dephospho-CoA kinase [Morganella morganii]